MPLSFSAILLSPLDSDWIFVHPQVGCRKTAREGKSIIHRRRQRPMIESRRESRGSFSWQRNDSLEVSDGTEMPVVRSARAAAVSAAGSVADRRMPRVRDGVHR